MKSTKNVFKPWRDGGLDPELNRRNLLFFFEPKKSGGK